ncbi:MAG: primosomal protein N' [Helicobacteraceae bacterium]|jgi:primosomal protein N' (replication factor Y)|nr:primosomal protein N' [Helicobacteraceae bacterium]
MFFYETALIGLAVGNLIYACDRPIESGTKIIVSLRKKSREAIVIKQVDRPAFACENICEVLDEKIAPCYMYLADFISRYYMCEIAEALALFFPAKNTTLEPISINTQIALSAAQNEALDFVQKHKISLLFGDTGSGKTEIYMKLFEQALNENKTALFLMPEISLTPQIQQRLNAHFGDRAALWHSKITKPKKRRVLEAIANGEARIIAGARSALFLPLPNLGAIVIDEEHDESYKNGFTPRYHARDVAITLAKKLDIPIVLGSATPSLTSYVKFPAFRLKGQYFAQGARAIRFIESASEEPASETIAAIAQTIGRGKQAIVFLPTRANFKYLVCQDCGRSVTCPFCEVGMSLHTHKQALLCHYCNASLPIARVCPHCGGGNLHAKRHGTAEIAKLLGEALPSARIALFDRDVIKTDRQLRAALNRFNNHDTDILVGTQMLSKGHDYHEVELAVALGLDRLLAQCDFRAKERSVALLTQLVGRAGRKSGALALIQTMQRGAFEPYIEDYERFIKDTIAERKHLFPPFTRLLRMLFAHADKSRAAADMERALSQLKQAEEVEIVGSGECAISRIKTKYRYYILLRSQSARALLVAARLAKKTATEIEIDPVSFA